MDLINFEATKNICVSNFMYHLVLQYCILEFLLVGRA